MVAKTRAVCLGGLHVPSWVWSVIISTIVDHPRLFTLHTSWKVDKVGTKSCRVAQR